MAEWVKDLALLHLWHSLQLWHSSQPRLGFVLWPGELPYATAGATKKEKKKTLSNHDFNLLTLLCSCFMNAKIISYFSEGLTGGFKMCPLVT